MLRARAFFLARLAVDVAIVNDELEEPMAASDTFMPVRDGGLDGCGSFMSGSACGVRPGAGRVGRQEVRRS